MHIRTVKLDINQDGSLNVMVFFTDGGYISASGNLDMIKTMLPVTIFDNVMRKLESIVLFSTSINVRKLGA
jgi:hypothetical protein